VIDQQAADAHLTLTKTLFPQRTFVNQSVGDRDQANKFVW
jgi:hypothetical protein